MLQGSKADHENQQPVQGNIIHAHRIGEYTTLCEENRGAAERERPAGGDVSVEAVGGEGQVLGVALHDGDPLERLLLPGLLELVRGLVEQRDVLRVDVLDDPERGEAGAAADVDDLEVAAVEVGGLERVVAHVLGPVARVDDVVVDDGEEAVEPEGLLLVLDEPRRRRGPRGGRRRRGRRAPQPRGAGTCRERAPTGEGEGAGEAAGPGGAEDGPPGGRADPGPSRSEHARTAARRVGGGQLHCLAAAAAPRRASEWWMTGLLRASVDRAGVTGGSDGWWMDGWVGGLRRGVLL